MDKVIKELNNMLCDILKNQFVIMKSLSEMEHNSDSTKHRLESRIEMTEQSYWTVADDLDWM